MMHKAAGNMTEPHAWDAGDLDDDSQFEAGKVAAADIEEPMRTQVYRQRHRVSQHPFSRGFRSYVIGGAR